MATRKAPAAPAPTPSTAIAVGQSVALADLPSPAARKKTRLPLPENAPFRFWVDPVRVRFIDGKPCANPIAVSYVPGAQGIGDDANPLTMDDYQRRLGRVPVPMTAPVVAFGESSSGTLRRMLVGTDRNGKQIHHYHSPWEKKTPVGNRVVVEFDHDGWDAFCVDCTALVEGGLHPVVVKGSRAAYLKTARQNARVAATQPAAGDVAAKILADIGEA